MKNLDVLACFLLACASCGCQEQATKDGAGVTRLHAWVHSGRESERRTIEAQVRRFNEQQQDIEVRLTLIPEGAYNAQVQGAALAGELPDLLEFDSPFVYNYVWQGHLIPIKDLISDEIFEDLIPSIIEQGTYEDRFWAVGMHDSGLGLYGNRQALESIDARIPQHPSEAWTVEEFNTILHRLAEQDSDGQVLDLKLNYRGEWFTHAYLPPLVSAGGDLVDRDGYATAMNVLNSEASAAAMGWFQRWIDEDKLVDRNVDDNAFVGGRVALSWVGHWEHDRYQKAYGDDLVLMPLPDFGGGSRTGQGSWCWGVTEKCADPETAGKFLDFLLQERQILEMTRANGAVPGTMAAIEKSEAYREESLTHLFAVPLTEGYAVPRPRTPAYPVMTALFQDAFKDIIHGADVQAVLDKTARKITQDIRDNQGYPLIKDAVAETDGQP